jgi:hypothetical protein
VVGSRKAAIAFTGGADFLRTTAGLKRGRNPVCYRRIAHKGRRQRSVCEACEWVAGGVVVWLLMELLEATSTASRSFRNDGDVVCALSELKHHESNALSSLLSFARCHVQVC